MRHRVKPWLVGIFLFFALLFISLRLVIAFWLNPIVEKVLKEAVSRYSEGLYAVNYESLRIRLLERKVSVENFQLTFDSTLLKSENTFRESIFVQATAREIDLAIGDIPDLIFNRYLKVRQLLLTAPEITLYNYQDSVKKNESEEGFNAFSLVREYFDSVHVQYVDISEGSVAISNVNGKPFRDFSLNHISATIVNMVIDSGTVYRNHGYPQTDQFNLMVKNARYPLPDSLHEVVVGQAAFHPVVQAVVLSDIALVPVHSKYQLGRVLGYQKDWISCSARELRMDHIDLHKLVVDNTLWAGRLSVDSLRLDIFRDRRLPSRPPSKKPLLTEMIQAVDVPFWFDTIAVKEAYIQYEEHVEPAAQPGFVFFDGIYASIYHTTNIDSLSGKHLQADAQGALMGQSLLQAHFDIALNSSSHWHRITGSLEETPLNAINAMIEPTAFASVQSGTGHKIEFDMEVTDEKASGNIWFEYSDLKVALLNKEDPDDPKLKEKVGSLIANWFVVKTNNPQQSDQPLREGIIFYPRKPERSFANYWIQALLSGMKVSVGIEKEPKMEKEDTDALREKPKDTEKKGIFKKLFSRKKGR